ncbi:hypothetical protein ACLOJK_007908 [Asimina triloba]
MDDFDLAISDSTFSIVTFRLFKLPEPDTEAEYLFSCAEFSSTCSKFCWFLIRLGGIFSSRSWNRGSDMRIEFNWKPGTVIEGDIMAQSNWEADKMYVVPAVVVLFFGLLLDVYIYDYLLKRNLHASAKAFMAEGKVAVDPVGNDVVENRITSSSCS